MGWARHREQVQENHHDNQKYNGPELSEDVSSAHLFTPVLVPLCLSVPVRHMAKEHVVEEFLSVRELGVEIVTTVSVSVLWLESGATTSAVLLLLRKPRYAAELVIESTLGIVTKSHHGVVNSLKCLFCLRSSVLIRMQFQCPLFVSLLQLGFRRLLLHSENLVVASE